MMKRRFRIFLLLIAAALVLAAGATAVPPADQKLSVEEIRGELVAIQDEIDEINDLLDDGGGDLGEIEAKISAIEGNITALEAALTLLEGNVNSLDSNVSALGSNVNALDSNVSAVQEDMGTLTGTVYVTGNAGVNQPYSIRTPYLGLNYIICLQGMYPSRDAALAGGIEDEPVVVRGINEGTLGEVTLFAGNFAPRGWAFCHGQLLPINQYQALFSILGTTYGGDGRTTFALPDLRGRVPVGVGYGPGLSDIRLGQKAGYEAVQLTVNQLPAHLHGFSLHV